MSKRKLKPVFKLPTLSGEVTSKFPGDGEEESENIIGSISNTTHFLNYMEVALNKINNRLHPSSPPQSGQAGDPKSIASLHLDAVNNSKAAERCYTQVKLIAHKLGILIGSVNSDLDKESE